MQSMIRCFPQQHCDLQHFFTCTVLTCTCWACKLTAWLRLIFFIYWVFVASLTFVGLLLLRPNWMACCFFTVQTEVGRALFARPVSIFRMCLAALIIGRALFVRQSSELSSEFCLFPGQLWSRAQWHHASCCLSNWICRMALFSFVTCSMDLRIYAKHDPVLSATTATCSIFSFAQFKILTCTCWACKLTAWLRLSFFIESCWHP